MSSISADNCRPGSAPRRWRDPGCSSVTIRVRCTSPLPSACRVSPCSGRATHRAKFHPYGDAHRGDLSREARRHDDQRRSGCGSGRRAARPVVRRRCLGPGPRKRSVKLLHLVSSLDPKGGGPMEVVLQGSLACIRLGHEVEVATLDAPRSGVSRRISAASARGSVRPDRATAYAPRLRPLAARTCRTVRCRRGQRTLAIPWLRCLACLASIERAVFRISARHAGSVVQARISGKASEEVALLALGPNIASFATRAHCFFTCEEERLLARQSFWLYRAPRDRRRLRHAETRPPTVIACARSF